MGSCFIRFGVLGLVAGVGFLVFLIQGRARVLLVIWGTNLGLVGFVIGLSADSAAIKRVSTPIMGLAILFGIWLLFSALRTQQREAVTVA
jgi:uncharacterized membrane protein YuzA (DUF378 family)